MSIQDKYLVAANGMRLSRMVYGTHLFGKRTDYEQTEKLLNCYLDAGGNILDTAHCAEYGRSEEFIGQYLARHPERRKDMYICTKWGNPIFNEDHTGVARFRFSCEDFQRDLTESLQLLQTDYIDIYLLHKYHPDLDVQAIIEMMNEPVKDGRAKHIGVSNWPVEAIAKANAYAEKKGLQKFEFSEISYSLYVGGTEGWGEVEMIHVLQDQEIPLYKELGITVFCFSAQAAGFFFKNFNIPIENVVDKRNKPENIARLKRLRDLCQKKGLSPQQALYGFYAGQDFAAIPAGTSTDPAHLATAINDTGVTLSKEEIQYLLGQ